MPYSEYLREKLGFDKTYRKVLAFHERGYPYRVIGKMFKKSGSWAFYIIHHHGKRLKGEENQSLDKEITKE